jgi:hypothetical protein
MEGDLINEAELRRSVLAGENEADRLAAEWKPTIGAETPQLPYLSQRGDMLSRDIAKMRAKKLALQGEIASRRRTVFELTQSIRSNEDALDRLLEAEG